MPVGTVDSCHRVRREVLTESWFCRACSASEEGQPMELRQQTLEGLESAVAHFDSRGRGGGAVEFPAQTASSSDELWTKKPFIGSSRGGSR